MNHRGILKFRLYVAGGTPNSSQAQANLNAICQAHLPGRHQIEIIDVLRDPRRGLADRVFLTPTVIKYSPLPARKIVGNLSNHDLVLQALGLAELQAV